MLTGDENIVDVDFSVQWVISDAADYLFNIENQESTVKAVAESAMREVIGNSNLEQILHRAESNERAVRDLMQSTLDEYGAGILIDVSNYKKLILQLPLLMLSGMFRLLELTKKG